MKTREKILIMRSDLMKEHHNTNLMFLHDLLHRCKVFNEHLDDRNFDILKKELDELYSISFKNFNLLYSNSIIINSLISERLTIINKNNINIKTVIEYNDFAFLSLYEQDRIFSTVLDIAISSNVNFDSLDRNIIVKTSKKGQQVILHLIYSCHSSENVSEHIQNTLHSILSQNKATFSTNFDKITRTNSIIIAFFLTD